MKPVRPVVQMPGPAFTGIDNNIARTPVATCYDFANTFYSHGHQVTLWTPRNTIAPHELATVLAQQHVDPHPH